MQLRRTNPKVKVTVKSILLVGMLSCTTALSLLPFTAIGKEGEAQSSTSDQTDDNPKFKNGNGKIPLADLQRFTTVVDNIRSYYVKPTDDGKLFENAIRGMLGGLDPHSSYLDTEEYSKIKESTSGKFGGLGVEVLPEDGFIRVISPIDDTPAQKAGVHAGDLIIRLNDTPVKGLTVREAIEMMRGEKGSKIVLTIIRQGESKPLLIPVIRDTIMVQSVKSKMLDENYGYIRVTQFQSNSGEDLIKAVQTLKKNNGGKLKGLVLDLRNNPGGVFEPSVQISDAFLDRDKLKYDGVIVFTKGRIPNSQIKEKAHAGDILGGAPIVILVNGGSASASEIVAGALQDHKRAVIVGTQTFGKGSVQTLIPLKDKRGLKLTTALYYTPAGRSIQAIGIKPDIVVENIKLPAPQQDELSNLYLREEFLQGHLENGNDAKATTAKAKGDKGDKDKPELPLINTDYQLHEGLNVLKGLSLMTSN